MRAIFFPSSHVSPSSHPAATAPRSAVAELEVVRRFHAIPVKRHEFNIFADYHQFYLLDDERQPNFPEDVTDGDCRNRLKAAPYIVAVYPVRNMTVPVAVEFHDVEPPTDFTAWDHIAECSLDLPSGRAVIIGCSGYMPEASRIPVAPGCYRVRAHFGALDSLSADGLDGSDHYLLTLWPSPSGELQVFKQYDERA